MDPFESLILFVVLIAISKCQHGYFINKDIVGLVDDDDLCDVNILVLDWVLDLNQTQEESHLINAFKL